MPKYAAIKVRVVLDATVETIAELRINNQVVPYKSAEPSEEENKASKTVVEGTIKDPFVPGAIFIMAKFYGIGSWSIDVQFKRKESDEWKKLKSKPIKGKIEKGGVGGHIKRHTIPKSKK